MITKDNVINTVALLEATDGNTIHKGTCFFYMYKKNNKKTIS